MPLKAHACQLVDDPKQNTCKTTVHKLMPLGRAIRDESEPCLAIVLRIWQARAHRLGDVANQSDVGQEELQRAPIALCTCIHTRVGGSWAPWLVLGLLGWPVVEEQR